MAPTEASLLTNFLLVPAPLPSIMTLAQFAALFPRAHRASPQVRALYRDLQRRRNATVDAVAAAVAAEVRRGRAMRGEVVRARRAAEADEGDDELDIEMALYGPESGAKNPRHTLLSIIPEMDSALADVEAEIEQLEHEEAELLESLRQTVGSMSDLRYGRFGNGQLREGVIEGLKDFQEACESKT